MHIVVLIKMPLDLSATTPKHNYAGILFFLPRTAMTNISSENSNLGEDIQQQCFFRTEGPKLLLPLAYSNRKEERSTDPSGAS